MPTNTPFITAAVNGTIPQKAPNKTDSATAETFLKNIIMMVDGALRPLNRSAIILKESSKASKRSGKRRPTTTPLKKTAIAKYM